MTQGLGYPHPDRPFPVDGQWLYAASAPVAPAWSQLGDVTRSVWEEKARRYNEGDPRWWSCEPQEKT